MNKKLLLSLLTSLNFLQLSASNDDYEKVVTGMQNLLQTKLTKAPVTTIINTPISRTGSYTATVTFKDKDIHDPKPNDHFQFESLKLSPNYFYAGVTITSPRMLNLSNDGEMYCSRIFLEDGRQINIKRDGTVEIQERRS